MAQLVKDATAARLMRLLNAADAGAGRGGSGSPRRVLFARCTSATAVGGDDVLDQCYPAVVVTPYTDEAVPGEENEQCLLTVLGGGGDAETPTDDAVYLCVAAGEVSGDASGSIGGRNRVFGVPVGGGSTALTSGETNPGSYLHNVAVTNTWSDTGMDLVLPSAGTYLIICRATCQCEISALTGTFPGHVMLRLWDETAAAALSNTESVGVEAPAVNVYSMGTVTIQKVYTVASSRTIRLEFNLRAGPTYTSARVTPSVTPQPQALYSYVKIG
jgi:hypothetical protein